MSGGFAGFIGAMRADPEHRASALERARAAVDKPDEPFDDDELRANLMARGLAPGQLGGLAQRLSDCEAELEGEREKIERGERRAEQVRGMLERGQIGALDASARMDGDFGDAARAAQLERRAESLRRQIAAAQAMIAPPQQRDQDPLEAAASRAHAAFRDATREAMTKAEAGTRRSEPRPFAGPGAMAEQVIARSAGDCADCRNVGATAAESAQIHAGLAQRSAAAAYSATPYCRGCGGLANFCSCGEILAVR